MKIKDIINEESKFKKSLIQSLESFLKENINELDVDIIKQMIRENNFLYRGINPSSPKSKNPWFCDLPRDIRNPKDTRFYLQVLIDVLFEKFGVDAKRSNSFFCTGDFDVAKNYANNNEKYVFIVLPSKNFSFYSNKRIEDLYVNRDYYLKDILEKIEKTLTKDEKVRLLTDENIKKINDFLIELYKYSILNTLYNNIVQFKNSLNKIINKKLNIDEVSYYMFLYIFLKNRDESNILEKIKNEYKDIDKNNFSNILFEFIRFVLLSEKKSILYREKEFEFSLNIEELRERIIKYINFRAFSKIFYLYNKIDSPQEKKYIFTKIFNDLLFNDKNIPESRKKILEDLTNLFIKDGITEKSNFIKAIESGNEILLRGRTCFIRNLYKDIFIDVFKKLT